MNRVNCLLTNKGKGVKLDMHLSRNATIKGIVVRGKQLGRTIGFPTANIAPYKLLNLQKGVYGVYVDCRGNRYIGVMNVEERPSFDDGNHTTYEVHILDFNENIYEEEIAVEIAFYIRQECKFSSVSDLIQQLKKDVHYTFTLLGGNTHIDRGRLHA